MQPPLLLPLPTLGDELDAMERGLSPAALKGPATHHPRWVEHHFGRGRLLEERDAVERETKEKSTDEQSRCSTLSAVKSVCG